MIFPEAYFLNLFEKLIVFIQFVSITYDMVLRCSKHFAVLHKGKLTAAWFLYLKLAMKMWWFTVMWCQY